MHKRRAPSRASPLPAASPGSAASPERASPPSARSRAAPALPPAETGLVRLALLPWVAVAATVVAGAAASDWADGADGAGQGFRAADAPGWGWGASGVDSLEAWGPMGVGSAGYVFWLGALIQAYAASLHVSRSLLVAPWCMCEVLWGCNTALWLAGFGMMTGRPLLVGAASLIVGLDQLCWYIDCGAFLATGSFPLGVCRYLVSPQTTRVHFATSFHHLWFLPACFFALRGVGMPPLSYPLSVALTSFVAVCARLLLPFQILVEDGSVKVLNVNMAYEFWSDVDVPLAHLLDHRHPLLYLPFLIVVCNLCLNTLPVVCLYFTVNLLA